MQIKYLGHSTFFIKSDENVSVLTDPYKPGAYGGALTYGPITDLADLVVLSHDHEDHADIKGLPNQPPSVRAACRVRGLEFDMVDTFHDNEQGAKRGPNRVICFEMDEIRVCHLGDLGHILSDEQVQEIGNVDVLLIPVGGTFTIGPDEATDVVEQLKPNIVIPMHYKTDKCAFPIEPIDSFLKDKQHIRRATGSEVIINKPDLPDQCTILYLPPGN